MPRLISVALACASFMVCAEAQDIVRKTIPVSTATRMTLNAQFGSIEVQPAAVKSVDVEVSFRGTAPSQREFDRMLGDFELEVTEQASDIRIYGTFRKGWVPLVVPGITSSRICRDFQCLEYSWLRGVEYRVTVPQRFDAEVRTSGGAITVGDLTGDVNARTSGGAIHIGRVDGPVKGTTSGGSITLVGSKGRALLHTSGGAIRITEVTGDIDASTSGGSISIDRASGHVHARTSGGPITVREVTGGIDASTSGGSVTASLTAQPKEESHLSTSGGSINVRLAKEVRVDLQAATSGGRVSTDYPVTASRDRHQRSLHAALNGGGPLLYLHTSGGGISVRRAD